MWRRIEIRNYRSIESVDVDIAPFTLVVGPNGSGKSNFVDAFVFARDVAYDASSAVQNRGGISGVRRWSPSKPYDVTIDVRVSANQKHLDNTYMRHRFTLGSKREGEWEFKRESIVFVRDGQTSFNLSRQRNTMEVSEVSAKQYQLPNAFPLTENTSAMFTARQSQFMRTPLGIALRMIRRFRLNPEAMRQPQVATERTRLDENGANITVAVQSLKERERTWEPLLLAMQKIVPGLVDIEVSSVGRYLVLKFIQNQTDARAEFAATEISDGAMRALGILVAAQQMTRDELLIIEEPEVALHPGAATLLFDVLKSASERGAVLLTTHSPDLLDAARDEEILVCEYRGGVTKIGPLAEAQRALVRKGLFSISELMRSEPLRIQGMEPDVIVPPASK